MVPLIATENLREAESRSWNLLTYLVCVSVFLKVVILYYRMCPVFGVDYSTLYVWLDYALDVLWTSVQRDDLYDFRIRWPSTQ